MVGEKATTRGGVEISCLCRFGLVLEGRISSVGAGQEGNLRGREGIICEVTAANGVGWESREGQEGGSRRLRAWFSGGVSGTRRS